MEGGGMRGVFAAGVLDCFLEKNFDPFDTYLGVSAGACNLASHLGKQFGRNYRSYTEYMLLPEFFSLKKYLQGSHYMDLDWLWDHMARVEPLNVKGAAEKEFYMVVTRVQTGGAVYLRADERTLFEALKASCAMPLLYQGVVNIEGSEYLDGGLADSIPVQEAHRRGARRIMVIRSQLAFYSKKSFWENRCIPLFFRRNPALRQALSERESRYNSVLSFIKNPPTDTEVLEICPSTIRSGRTTRARHLLEMDYAEGKRMGLCAIQKWQQNKPGNY